MCSNWGHNVLILIFEVPMHIKYEAEIEISDHYPKEYWPLEEQVANDFNWPPFGKSDSNCEDSCS